MFRLIGNFLIAGLLVWLFQQFGWIQIQTETAPFESAFANQVLVSCIIGLVFTIALWIAGIVYAVIVVMTCGVGCLLFPLYFGVLGFVGFWLVSLLLPGWVTIANTHPVLVIVMGLLLAFIRIPQVSVSTSRSTSTM